MYESSSRSHTGRRGRMSPIRFWIGIIESTLTVMGASALRWSSCSAAYMVCRPAKRSRRGSLRSLLCMKSLASSNCIRAKGGGKVSTSDLGRTRKEEKEEEEEEEEDINVVRCGGEWLTKDRSSRVVFWPK